MTVYRPANFKLPPSRGRTGFKFLQDGSYQKIGIGATDISAISDGRWQVADENAGEVQITSGAGRDRIKVVSLTDDKLVVEKQEPK